jgi:hypothetical protein
MIAVHVVHAPHCSCHGESNSVSRARDVEKTRHRPVVASHKRRALACLSQSNSQEGAETVAYSAADMCSRRPCRQAPDTARGPDQSSPSHAADNLQQHGVTDLAASGRIQNETSRWWPNGASFSTLTPAQSTIGCSCASLFCAAHWPAPLCTLHYPKSIRQFSVTRRPWHSCTLSCHINSNFMALAR